MRTLCTKGANDKKRTSGAKALIPLSFYGTAEAVPFVQGILTHSLKALMHRPPGRTAETFL
jgi:hypothetical protein